MVIAERIGWHRSVRVLRNQAAGLPPLFRAAGPGVADGVSAGRGGPM
jgi:hypothetical protein